MFYTRIIIYLFIMKINMQIYSPFDGKVCIYIYLYIYIYIYIVATSK